MDVAKQLASLINLLQTVTGGTGILIGLWIGWKVFLEWKKAGKGGGSPLADVATTLARITDTQVRIVEMLHKHSEGEMAALQRMSDSLNTQHIETLARLADIRADVVSRR